MDKTNLDMAVSRDPLSLDGALHFVDLHLEADVRNLIGAGGFRAKKPNFPVKDSGMRKSAPLCQ